MRCPSDYDDEMFAVDTVYGIVAAVAAILGFQNFAFLIKLSNLCYAKVDAVQISAKKLNPCGSY